MEKGTEPVIEVGILKAHRISFRLEGRFRIQNGGVSVDPQEAIEGAAEVVLNKGMVEVQFGGGDLISGKTLAGEVFLFEPMEAKTSRFLVHDVVIGIGFHWEQKEDQKFQGALKILVSGDQIQVVNLVPVEDYLISVISSEMRGDSSPALLKAHTIISRSWLLAQINKQDTLVEGGKSYEMIQKTEDTYIRWYDREDHDEFHVCADDHCQRYQGITRAHNPEVVKAVNETTGEVLMYGGGICDARFSKCCGGVVEEFEYCWEPVRHPYLKRVDDNPSNSPVNVDDLKIELNALKFITGNPDAFCNTQDAQLLGQVLNDYDHSFTDFYRWKVVYGQKELGSLIRKKSGIDFGQILDLIPIERGESGRLVRLKVVGTNRTITVGKELEIRRWLSESHLYSSAFIVEKLHYENGIPGSFTFFGSGWGHGVGLCQIGAAVMASRGYTHHEILNHYFVNATLDKPYE